MGRPSETGRPADSAAVMRLKQGVKMLSNPAVLVLLAGSTLAVKLQQLASSGQLEALLQHVQETTLSLSMSVAVLGAGLALAALLAWQLWFKSRVYLLDFVAKRPDDSWTQTREDSEECGRLSNFTEEAFDFQRKVMWVGGLGNKTYFPPWITRFPQDISMAAAKKEFDMVVLEACKDLFAKTGVKPSQIGVLVVNCSLFVPTPSWCAHIMNHFKMGSDVLSFNLGGMGCSASPIAIDLARRMLLQVPNTYALVVSTENITQNIYRGVQRSMLIPNVLFRVGAAAMLLTNKRSEARRSKYWLHSLVRTNNAADDASYNCVMEMEDAEGHRGVKLSKDLMKIAGKALRTNITTLGPKVLPLSEIVVFAGNLIARKVLRVRGMKPYVPDFQEAAQHICIHTGGRGVIDTIQSELGLTKEYVEPSRAALYRYGNVSSSSIWYVLSFIEHFRGVKAGDRVLQIAFGSGFKCNSAVWVANRSISEKTYTWEGFDAAEMYEDLAQLEVRLREYIEQQKKDKASAEAAAEAAKVQDGAGKPLVVVEAGGSRSNSADGGVAVA